VSTQPPRLLARLVDDAAVFPPGNAPLPDAVTAHRRHRTAWYAGLVGPLLVPASAVGDLSPLLGSDDRLAVGVIGDRPLAELTRLLGGLDPRLELRQVETPVARRGEDPQPGLAALAEACADWPGVDVYAEVPLAWGLIAALDTLAGLRADGRPVAAKFRTGGLAAELFPTPAELAAVICACRDRDLPFKLTAGLHHAVRHTDPATGLRHHGFVNVLVATAAAHAGAGVPEVAALLGGTDEAALVGAARPALHTARPLWVGYGSCSIAEPVADLVGLGLLVDGEGETR
jgi:hypothetical protein